MLASVQDAGSAVTYKLKYIDCHEELVRNSYSLHKKCPYLELFWSAFSRIRTSYLLVFSPNAGNCGPE